jgi:hypothetical protein
MSEVSEDERTNARAQEAADNAEQILPEATNIYAPSRRRLTDAIVHVPLHSLAIAFLLGAIIARRR